VFLNIGKFSGGKNGLSGNAATEFYTLSRAFIREHHDTSTSWQKVRLGGLEEELQPFKDEAGFELIAKALGVARPSRGAQ